MKKIINKVTYNTETSEELGVSYRGEFGDAAGYEERLYKTKKEEFFLFGQGGPDSKYPAQGIEPISERTAKLWLKENKAATVK